MDQVKKAIYTDFGLRDDKINSIKHPQEQTKSLAISVEKLVPTSGKSRVVSCLAIKLKG
jgi:hypothetical protein